jgi:uncharacterized LabA/DUF88 family protein
MSHFYYNTGLSKSQTKSAVRVADKRRFLGKCSYIATNQSLYISLQNYGYILVFKPTLVLPSGRPKGNVDAELVLHAMIEYPNYEKAVIVAGDGDYYCLVDYLRKRDKLLRLIIPDQYKYSSLLRKFVPQIVFMNNLRHKLERRE